MQADGTFLAAGSTDDAENVTEATCGGGDAPEVVFGFIAPSAGTWVFSTRVDDGATSYDTVLYARSDCEEPAPERELACNDDINPGVAQSVIRVEFERGEGIYIFVDGFADRSGDFWLTAVSPAVIPDGEPCDPRDRTAECGVDAFCADIDFDDAYLCEAESTIPIGGECSVDNPFARCEDGSRCTDPEDDGISNCTPLVVIEVGGVCEPFDRGSECERSAICVDPDADGVNNCIAPVIVQQVAAGITYSYAIDREQRVWSIGVPHWDDPAGTGLGDCARPSHPSPGLVPGLLGIRQMSAGRLFAVALDQDGRVHTWGRNERDQLGDGTGRDRCDPLAIDLAPMAEVRAGHLHVAALDADGQVWVWGDNAFGQLGIGDAPSASLPVRVGGLPRIAALDAGEKHTVALAEDGSVWIWGGNDFGQLGRAGDGALVPERVAGIGPAIEVHAGGNGTFIKDTDGLTWGWGGNWEGELCLGYGFEFSHPQPTRLPALDGLFIEAGYAFALGGVPGGGLLAWGGNLNGQLGDGQAAEVVPNAQPVLLPFLGLSTFTAGAHHSLAVSQEGRVWAWGSNESGQLGTGDTADSNWPVEIVFPPEGIIEPGGQICYESIVSPDPFCYRRCGRRDDCAADEMCQLEGDAGVCVPDCRVRGCPDRLRCEEDGHCRLDTGLLPVACQSTDECPGCCVWRQVPGEVVGDPPLWDCLPLAPGETGTCLDRGTCEACVSFPGAYWREDNIESNVCWDMTGRGVCVGDIDSCWFPGGCDCLDSQHGACVFRSPELPPVTCAGAQVECPPCACDTDFDGTPETSLPPAQDCFVPQGALDPCGCGQVCGAAGGAGHCSPGCPYSFVADGECDPGCQNPACLDDDGDCWDDGCFDCIRCDCLDGRRFSCVPEFEPNCDCDLLCR